MVRGKLTFIIMLRQFIKRNAPVFVIGGMTVVFFLVIIVLDQTKPHTEPQLNELESEGLIASHTYTLGPEKASVVLVEFANFECSSCALYHPVLKNLAERYPNKLRVAFRHFPFESQLGAKRGAEADQAAGAQDKFWEYAGILYENPYDLYEDDLISYAQELGLDVEKFESDLKSGKYADAVEEDIAGAEKLGLDSTPTFFLNGKKLDLVYIGDLKEKVEEMINR